MRNTLIFWPLILGFCLKPLHVSAQVKGKKIDYTTIRSGHTDKFETTSRTFEIIDSREDLVGVWIELYIRMLPIPKIPNVDFEEGLVIFFLSDKDNVGYKSKITNIRIKEYPNYIKLSYEEISAGPGCFKEGERAYRLIRFKNLGKNIRFERIEKESENCYLHIY